MTQRRSPEHATNERKTGAGAAAGAGQQWADGRGFDIAEAAAYLRLAESEVVGLAHTQGLPGRCVAGEWRFLKAALEHWLATGSPTWDTRKAAILELSGKYKDDPDLETIVEEAYRRRG